VEEKLQMFRLKWKKILQWNLLIEICGESVDVIELDHYRLPLQALVNAVINLRVQKKNGNSSHS
jgi:hypothetical protein